jgi:molecular chaperone GrpE
MAKTNGKGNGDANRLDLDHELPEGFDEQGSEIDDSAPESQAKASAAEQETEIDRLRSERAMYLDRLARLQAEFDNYRKRSVREQQEFRDYALVDALKQLLPILDSLDHALRTENASAGDFRAGVDLIDRQFHDVLSKLGVEPIKASGEPFDPTLHQAIQMVETDETNDNHVIDELQRGYKLHDRLLRPAMVRVASNPKK